MSRHAVLPRFELRMFTNTNIKMRHVKVVKDHTRHIIHLIGNPFQVTLLRNDKKQIIAHSQDLGIFGLVKDVPKWMVKLLS